MSDPVEVIESNVAFAVEQLGPLVDFDFGLDRRSLEWLEGFIERQRARTDVDPTGRENLIGVLGSFLGACVVAGSAGEWAEDADRGPGVRFPNGAMCFPFAKVRKQFADGREAGESVLSFYDIAVDLVAVGKLGRSDGA